MANEKMHTLVIGDTAYDVYDDEAARATEVEALSGEVETLSGAVAPLEELPDKVTALTEDIGGLAEDIFTVGDVEIPLDEIEGITKVPASNAFAYADKITFPNNTGFDSYYFYPQTDAQIYIGEGQVSAAGNYLAICYIYDAQPITDTLWINGSNGVRLRNLESNLPTQDAPLTIKPGMAVAITVTVGTSISIGYKGQRSKTLNPDVVLNDTQVEQVVQHLNNTGNTIAFDGTTFKLCCGPVNYYIAHETNTAIRQDTWRVRRGSIVSNNVESDMWNGSDADGVVRMKGENDFVGGYHGDELTTSVSVFIDGVEADIETAFGAKKFSTFAMFATSDVYHCVDSENAVNVAFKRNKEIFFDGEKLSISNYWAANETVNVTTAYFGMLSVAKSLVTHYSINSKNALVDNETQAAGAKYCDKAQMFLSTGNVVEYAVADRSAQEPYGYGELYNGSGVSNRVKVYFAEIYKLDGLYITLNQGDVIRATSVMAVK